MLMVAAAFNGLRTTTVHKRNDDVLSGMVHGECARKVEGEKGMKRDRREGEGSG